MRRWLTAAAVVVLVGSAHAGAATAETVAGSGMASAVVARVGPVGDNLSFVVAWGESLADHQGSSARAQSAVADFGLLGFFLTTPVCPHSSAPVDKKYLPPITRTQSSESGAADGRHTTLVAAPAAPVQGGAGDERAWATKDPAARAATALSTIGAPGAIELAGGRSEVHTGAAGPGREAAATSAVDTLDVLHGTLHLEGLRWDVAQHSDATGSVDRATGTFRLGHASVRGQEVTLDPGATPAAQLAAVNLALATTGLVLVAPAVSVDQGAVTVSPLGLRVTDSPAARATIAPVVSALQPVRQPVAGAITQKNCSAALAIEAYDVMSDAMAGNGGMIVEIGGVAATTEGNRFASPFLEIPHAASTGGGPAASEAASTAGAAPSVRAGTAATPPTSGHPAVAAPRSLGGRLAGGTRTLDGAAGGIAAVAALASVGALVGLALGDRRRIRARTGR